MGEQCSCPGCTSAAKYEVVAENAGSQTGQMFYTCERHGMESDDKIEI